MNRQIDRHRPTACIRADEQEVFASNDKILDGSFGRIVMCALTRCTGYVGTKSHPATLAPAGSTRSGSGGDEWSEALWEKPLK